MDCNEWTWMGTGQWYMKFEVIELARLYTYKAIIRDQSHQQKVWKLSFQWGYRCESGQRQRITLGQGRASGLILRLAWACCSLSWSLQEQSSGWSLSDPGWPTSSSINTSSSTAVLRYSGYDGDPICAMGNSPFSCFVVLLKMPAMSRWWLGWVWTGSPPWWSTWTCVRRRPAIGSRAFVQVPFWFSQQLILSEHGPYSCFALSKPVKHCKLFSLIILEHWNWISRWTFQHFQSDYLDIRTEDSVVRSQLCGQWDLRFVDYLHTFYLSQTPQTCLCKIFLSGVNFSRLSEKNAYIWLFQRHF